MLQSNIITDTDTKKVDLLKTTSLEIVDFFLTRQERLIPHSVKAGFSLFHSMVQFSNVYKDSCSGILDILSKKGITEEHKSICNWICIDAQTKDYHEDDDSSYSLICVPFVDLHKSPQYCQSRGQYSFVFCWDEYCSDDAKVSIKLDPGVGIYFLGPACNHKQMMKRNGSFVNMSSYQNKRLFDTLKCSIKRHLSIT